MFTLEKFPVDIVSNISEISVKNCIAEVRSTPVENILEKFSLPVSPKILQKISSRPEWENFVILYPENEKIFQMILFFPDENKLFDNRSEICQKFGKNSAFIPDGDVVDAFEIYTLATYNFDFYKTKKETSTHIFVVEDMSNIVEVELKIPLLEAILVSRNLVNMSPQDMNPETIVRAISEKKWNHFDVEIFGNAELRTLGCDLIRAVGKGSSRESFMVILKPKKEIPGEKYGFIGKWVTFDAGGIQIKPDKAMLDMKCDMAGAAGFLGVAMYLDSLPELPIHAVFGMGFVENMTGASAFKPLDVYAAYNGTSVEIHHTDAEGRLVLADVMSYVEKNFAVDHLVTMATLTGACLYALGNDISGVMGDDEKFISTLIDNTSTYEPVWRLPFPERLKDALKSDVADIKNLADGVYMGSSVGGAFLSFFQGNAKLTHLDIAGPAYRTKSWGYMPAGWTGWGVKKISETILSLK